MRASRPAAASRCEHLLGRAAHRERRPDRLHVRAAARRRRGGLLASAAGVLGGFRCLAPPRRPAGARPPAPVPVRPPPAASASACSTEGLSGSALCSVPPSFTETIAITTAAATAAGASTASTAAAREERSHPVELLLLRGQALEDLLPAARGQLEQRRGLKRTPRQLEPARSRRRTSRSPRDGRARPRGRARRGRPRRTRAARCRSDGSPAIIPSTLPPPRRFPACGPARCGRGRCAISRYPRRHRGPPRSRV